VTVSAIAKVDQAFARPADNQTSPDDSFYVGVHYWVTDGTTAHEGDASGIFPAAWSHRKSNRYVRERIAAAILSSWSLTIDPEDIYIPLS
jgi:hypothetical protein